MTTQKALQDVQKGHPARPQGKEAPEAYPLGYVEDASEPRTKLAAFFNILIETMAHLLDMMASLVDDRVGVVAQVEEVRKEAGAPDFVCFSAQTGNMRVVNPAQRHGVFWATGVAADRERAMAKAIGEAVERYCAANYCEEDLPGVDYEHACFPCVRPEEFTLYSAEQYWQPGFPYVPFAKKTPIRWVPALDLRTGETKYVPAARVFLGYTCDKNLGEQAIAPQISTGLACHTHPSLAAVSAVCEVIERDAVAITWQAKLTRPRIRLSTLSPQNRDLVERLKRPEASVKLLYLAMDHGVPVIFSVMTGTVPEAPALVVGAAAHLDPEQAVRRSLEELAQIWSFALRVKSTRPAFSPGAHWEQVVDSETHAAVYYDGAHARLAEFLYSSSEEMAFGEIKNLSTDNPSRDLRFLVEKIHGVNHRVLLADVTTEDMRGLGLFVVRAVIPGFHPLFMGHTYRALGGTRLWEIPQKLGYSGITRKQGDNPFPHPFP